MTASPLSTDPLTLWRTRAHASVRKKDIDELYAALSALAHEIPPLYRDIHAMAFSGDCADRSKAMISLANILINDYSDNSAKRFLDIGASLLFVCRKLDPYLEGRLAGCLLLSLINLTTDTAIGDGMDSDSRSFISPNVLRGYDKAEKNIFH